MNARDPYIVLGVPRGASLSRVQATYRLLAKRHHPDVIGGEDTAMAEINAAYQEIRTAHRETGWMAARDDFVEAFMRHQQRQAEERARAEKEKVRLRAQRKAEARARVAAMTPAQRMRREDGRRLVRAIIEAHRDRNRHGGYARKREPLPQSTMYEVVDAWAVASDPATQVRGGGQS